MKTMFNVFGKKLFGVRYERMGKNVFLAVVLFGGLSSAEYTLPIAPFFLFMISGIFTAGVMWQALCSKDNAEYIKNLVMMPFDRKDFMIGYVSSLALYTLVTKVLLVWTICFAVCKFAPMVIVTAVLFAVCSVIMTSCAFVWKKCFPLFLMWAAAILGLAVFFKNRFTTDQSSLFIMMAVLVVSALISLFLLLKADGYVIYDVVAESDAHRSQLKSHRHLLGWTYLFRYLFNHKNYLLNTVMMWGVSIIIPQIIINMMNTSGDAAIANYFLFMGFGIVSLNTPLCILVSCDHDLDRGLRCLPGSVKTFFLPYGAFLFFSNMISFTIYLISCQIQLGGVGVLHILCAVILAAFSATGSVLLEWFAPVRSWKIESDLWHHPRKYVVPATTLLVALLFGTVIG